MITKALEVLWALGTILLNIGVIGSILSDKDQAKKRKAFKLISVAALACLAISILSLSIFEASAGPTVWWRFAFNLLHSTVDWLIATAIVSVAGAFLCYQIADGYKKIISGCKEEWRKLRKKCTDAFIDHIVEG